MVRIVRVRINDQEPIKKNGIHINNIISATPVLDMFDELIVIIVYDDGVTEDA